MNEIWLNWIILGIHWILEDQLFRKWTFISHKWWWKRWSQCILWMPESQRKSWWKETLQVTIPAKIIRFTIATRWLSAFPKLPATSNATAPGDSSTLVRINGSLDANVLEVRAFKLFKGVTFIIYHFQYFYSILHYDFPASIIISIVVFYLKRRHLIFIS